MSQEDDEFIEGISEAYRFRTITQITLFAIMAILVIVITELLILELEIRVTTIIVVCAFVFPIFVKERNRFTRACSMGLFFSAIALMIYYIYPIAIPFFPPTQTTILLIAAVLAISIQLFEYLLPTILKRDSLGYTIIVLISVIFSMLVTVSFNLFPPFGPFSVWSVVFFAIIFMVFTYAILPEKPI